MPKTPVHTLHAWHLELFTEDQLWGPAMLWTPAQQGGLLRVKQWLCDSSGGGGDPCKTVCMQMVL